MLGVIGAGTMGNGIAQVFSMFKHPVVLVDVDAAAVKRGTDAIKGSLDRIVRKEKMTADEAHAVLGRIRASTSLKDLAEAELVVEAIVENAAVKEKLFRELDAAVRPDGILATNTSSIWVTKIAAATKRPDRVIGMHFMNPVPVMKLVEIIRGQDTSDATTAKVMDLARGLDKTPVEVKDSPGFVSNRVLLPMINEAIFCLHEGVGTAEAIDTVMRLGMAHPMGPLQLADFIGLDVCLAILEVLHKDLGDDKYRPCPLLRKMVMAGHLGKKSGRGFYTYA
ncbi:MAG TPA: 3-hydroxybutyryl-CoA dehydrogenase [Planctomycetota bacterium]|nr:3-hydroxybutyryl-CoA dehydrogenase [Planctomycetota bacterium]